VKFVHFIFNKFSINVVSFTKSGLGFIKIFLLKISGSGKQSKLPKIVPAPTLIHLVKPLDIQGKADVPSPSAPGIPSAYILGE